MKLPVHCTTCTSGMTDIGEFGKYLSFINVNDTGIYKYECQKGHKNVLVIQQLQYEVLFEIGVQALIDGYYREAIASFSSSLERLYELFVSVAAKVNNVKDTDFVACWKKIAASSERQLGAYVFVYLQLNKTVPSILKEKWRNLRNNVVHKGYIPSYNEALSYGNEVYKAIMSVLIGLKLNNEESLNNVCWNIVSSTINKAMNENAECKIVQADLPFVINWNRLHYRSIAEIPTLEDRMQSRPKCFSVLNG